MAGGTFCEVGGGEVHVKITIQNFVAWFDYCDVQALEYDAFTCIPYEGLNCTIVDKITPLWKRIGELPGIQIGCYRGDSRSTESLGPFIRYILTEENGLTLGSLKFLFAFILVGTMVALRRYLRNNTWEVLMLISPLFSNVRHRDRAVITPVRPLITRFIHTVA